MNTMTPQKTMEISPAIIEQINETPEERKYWRHGLGYTRPSYEYSAGTIFGTSEAAARRIAAWMLRTWPEHYYVVTAPFECTKEQADAIARLCGGGAVVVQDESLQEVERWSVT